MKTAELTGALLDYWVARAEGLEIDKLADCYAIYTDKDAFIGYVGGEHVPRYSPSEQWAQGGPLIEKYRPTVGYEADGAPFATIDEYPAGSTYMEGATPLQAICRAVVRAAFGDEVEEVAV